MIEKNGIKDKAQSNLPVLLLAFFASTVLMFAQEGVSAEAIVSNTAKPWTRWWWMGNAVDTAGIRQNLQALSDGGLGGVEITPIYGVQGEEVNYLDYLSPKWIEMLDYTITTAHSLGMQVDMTLGTGWPYGGPQVTPAIAATKLVVEEVRLLKGERIQQEIIVENEKNKKNAVLLCVLAFGEDGEYTDLTDKLKGNFLSWKARGTNYTLYKVFTGKTGQQVKRAAPGGQGYTLDHYSKKALKEYLVPFESAFAKLEKKPRAIFNDSFEVYGTDFTPNFFEIFEAKRGYDLKPHLHKLMAPENAQLYNRIRSDYRETLSDLLLTEFDRPWTEWAHNEGTLSKLQAHGSPGNLIDLYASADIPECETFGSMPFDIPGLRREKDDIREGDADAVMLKFSSSAAHISGKPLTSSETFTWLRDHFKTALSQCKPEAEDLLLNGVNHIFLHGSTYSPQRAAWPGWKFYASVNFNPNNTIWEDAPELFSYITRCQSLLQAGKPDNDLLVYWPIYDIWDDYLDGNLFFQFKIHSLDEWLHDTPFYDTANKLMRKGYGTDFISDAFIAKSEVVDGKIVLPGGSYKGLVVPDSDKMPLRTLEHLIRLKKKGATIIFKGLPESVPGFYDYEAQNKTMRALLDENRGVTDIKPESATALVANGIVPETLVDTGLKYIRRDVNGSKVYYLVNHTKETVNGFIPLEVQAEEILIMDPLTNLMGKAVIENTGARTRVKVNISSGRSLFLKTGSTSDTPPWKYTSQAGDMIPIHGHWELSFTKGGPRIPRDTVLTSLHSWTDLGLDTEYFSGTARYKTTFDKPETEAEDFLLDLGDVRESAKVWLNDNYLGTAWSVPFTLKTGQLEKTNTLVVEVTNLPANRIRAKEIRGEEWKIFHEINMVDKDYKKFDATKWNPMPSGLIGPVRLIPLKSEN
ncbi:glycosyl hydrolase [Pareuzebyella sediminis]|uniref:glycosyl hydrolase n=1 Tax=Pareuzebyella sediminis TaxID=2607998 RepID=UPI0011ECD080|nr:glycosyl hydrolase [Pareuzebyella sediminis]